MKRLTLCLTALGALCLVAMPASAVDSKGLTTTKSEDCCAGCKPAACATTKTTSNTHTKVRVSKVLMSPKAMELAGK